MTKINGIDTMSRDQLYDEVMKGGKFIIFEYVISFIFFTIRRGSDVFFIRAGENSISKGMPYSLLTFVVGWWGLPWGPFYTFSSINTNLSGGKNITSKVMAALNVSPPRSEIENPGKSKYPRHLTINEFEKLTFRQQFAVKEYRYLLSPEDAETTGKMLGNFHDREAKEFTQERGEKVVYWD